MTLDVRASVSLNLTVSDCTHLAVAVTNDSTYAVSVGSIYLNVTLNSDARDVSLATIVVSEAYEYTHVEVFLTLFACELYCSVLDYEVLDSSTTIDITEETTAEILITISIRSYGEVLDSMVLTIEVTVE